MFYVSADDIGEDKKVIATNLLNWKEHFIVFDRKNKLELLCVQPSLLIGNDRE